ncbi:MAG: hypothetical protein ACTHK4_00015 [Mycobacteriales bacterium]
MRPGVIAGVLVLLSGVLVGIAASGWSGPVPAFVTLVVVFLAPGVGWQNLRGTLRFTPARLGLASATSIGCVVVVGLLMNAASVSLTQRHWAVALTAVLVALVMATVALAPQRSNADAGVRRTGGEGSRRLTAATIAACCAVLAGGGAALAWYSQQHWLDRQHFTELYGVTTGAGQEVITVHNQEGRAVTYRATITAAGQPAAVTTFTLADGAKWTRLVAVDPHQATQGRAMLLVTLNRVGVPGVYRWIRLFRPQPTAAPS